MRASTLSVSGTLSAAGEDGELGCAESTNWCGTATGGSSPSEGEPGGGGAGGTLTVIADTLVLGEAGLFAAGGSGQLSGSSWAKTSGTGGDGYVGLVYGSLNGALYGSAEAEAAEATVCSPAPSASTAR